MAVQSAQPRYGDVITDFQTPVFACCDAPGTCVFATVCPGCQQGLNINAVTDGESGVCVQGSVQCCAAAGSSCDDCLVHCFCYPCALTQEAREIQLRKSQGYKYLDTPAKH
jgi:hypothetical protein